MTDLEAILFVFAFAVLNRARGSQLFGLTTSTVIGRLMSMGGMAVVTSLMLVPNTTRMVEVFAVAFGGLMLWATPAWDSYWSAEIGNDPSHSKLWGCLMMGWRQLLIVPTFAGEAFLIGHPERAVWAATAGLYWLPYFAFGAMVKPRAVEFSEYTIGALIGMTIYIIVHV